jgi:hypothetical protein
MRPEFPALEAFPERYFPLMGSILDTAGVRLAMLRWRWKLTADAVPTGRGRAWNPMTIAAIVKLECGK